MFGAFLVITMWVVLRAGKSTKEASDFYTGGGSFSGRQNGLAISGDYSLRLPSSASSARWR